MKKLLLAVLLLACASPAFAGYGYYRTVTIDHTKVPSTQTDFTVLVCANGQFASDCATIVVSGLNQSGGGAKVQNSSGYDIVFGSNIGCTSLLSWEMNLYTAASGLMYAFVKVPSVSSSVDTVFYMCYGNAAISTFQGGATGAAYDSFTSGVWHVSDGTTLNYTDASANGNNGTQHNTPVAIGAIVDGGMQLSTPSSQYFDAPNASSLTIGNTDSATWEVWFKTNMSGVGMIMAKAWATAARNGWGIYYQDGGGGFVTATIIADDSISSRISAVETTGVGDAAWHRLMVTYSGSGLSSGLGMRLDGAAATVTPSGTITTGSASSTAVFSVGADVPETQYYYNGQLDELKMSKGIVRNAGYDTANYNNQKTPSTFETFGSETPVPATGGCGLLLVGVGC